MLLEFETESPAAETLHLSFTVAATAPAGAPLLLEMNQRRIEMKALKVAALLTALCLLSFAASLSYGQEVLARAAISVDSLTPDAAKLEARALALLVGTYGLSEEEARAEVRTEGVLNAARCLELLVLTTLLGVSVDGDIGRVSAITLPRPTEPAEQPQ